MSRYTDLTAKALRQVEAFHVQQRKCNDFARKAAAGLRKYLEAPHGSVYFAAGAGYDDATEADWTRLDSPKLIPRRDRRLHFSLVLMFQHEEGGPYMQNMLEFGVSFLDGRYSVRVVDRDHSVDPGNQESWVAMFAEIV